MANDYSVVKDQSRTVWKNVLSPNALFPGVCRGIKIKKLKKYLQKQQTAEKIDGLSLKYYLAFLKYRFSLSVARRIDSSTDVK